MIDELEKIILSSTYGVTDEKRNYLLSIINTLKTIDLYIQTIDTSKLNEIKSKHILSYVYDVILTLDEFVDKLENIKDLPNE